MQKLLSLFIIIGLVTLCASVPIAKEMAEKTKQDSINNNDSVINVFIGTWRKIVPLDHQVTFRTYLRISKSAEVYKIAIADVPTKSMNDFESVFEKTPTKKYKLDKLSLISLKAGKSDTFTLRIDGRLERSNGGTFYKFNVK